MGFARVVKYAMIFLPTTKEPEPEEEKVYQCTVNTASALSGMLSRLMARTVTPRHIDETQLWIEEFLSCVHELDLLLGWAEKNQPMWFARANFLGLLNLPDMMRSYGPIRELWEGGAKGEGFIGEIKSHIYGVRDTKYWLRNMLQKIVKARSLKLILSQLDTKQSEAGGNVKINDDDGEKVTVDEGGCVSLDRIPLTWNKSIRYKGVYIWKNKSELDSAALITNKRPISAFRCSGGRLLVPFYNGNKVVDGRRVIATMRVDFEDDNGAARVVCGCWFSPKNLVENLMEGGPVNRDQVYQEANGFVLLLPLVVGDILLYYAVDDSWNERIRTGGFVPPGLTMNAAPNLRVIV